MMSMSWVMRLFVYVILLCISTIHQVTGGNKTYVQMRPDHNCVCYDVGGKVVNLTPLQSTDGSPRFQVYGSYGRKYGYNPCRSFTIGPAGSSDCYADVAICMWTTEGAKVYQNIGRQSTARCGYEKDHRTLRLEYSSDDARYAKNWGAHVIMKCDPSKSEEDATFEVLDDVHNPRRFLLTQNCLCPGQCPLDAINPRVTPNSKKPVMKPERSNKTEIVAGGAIGGVFAIIIIVVCYYKGKQIWRGITTCYCKTNNEENRLLNEERDQQADNNGNEVNNFIAPTRNKNHNLTSKRDNLFSV